jgi:hypothetical protein
MKKEIKNDFVVIFKAMTATEKEDFRRYISYFYGQQKVVLNTFENVVKAINVNEEITFLSDVQKNKTELNSLSDLKKWSLEFLTLHEIQNHSTKAQFLTIEVLRRRGLERVLERKVEKLQKELRKNSESNMWLSFLEMQIDHDNYFNTENDKFENHEAYLVHLMNSLDNFYIRIKLKYSAEMQSRTNIVQEYYEPRLLNDILLLAEQDVTLNPIIKAFYLPLFQLVRDKSEAAFEKIKAFIIHNQAHDRIERMAALIYLLNVITFRARQLNEDYCKAYFELAEIGIAQSLFIATKYFPTSTFNNIVNAACRLEKYKWATNFIETQAVNLKPDDNKEITVNLAKARINYEKKDFSIVVDLLEKVSRHKKKAFSLQMRVLLIRTYYEQKSLDKVESEGNNLELYLYRMLKDKRIAADLAESALNFIKILRLLINVAPKKKLLEMLDKNKKQIICHDWLTLKIAERKR